MVAADAESAGTNARQAKSPEAISRCERWRFREKSGFMISLSIRRGI
jgi:hypothetical protein